MQVNEAVAALLTALAAAFADAPQVPREGMVYRGSWETQDLIESLAKVGEEPTFRFIEWHAGSPAEFTPAGLRHVLPFYLRCSLANPQSDVTERVILHLSPTDTSEEYWRERLSVFTPAQKHAICEYIRFMQKELAGEHYDEYLARALAVWGAGSSRV
jgi:hypothetical protein